MATDNGLCIDLDVASAEALVSQFGCAPGVVGTHAGVTTVRCHVLELVLGLALGGLGLVAELPGLISWASRKYWASERLGA